MPTSSPPPGWYPDPAGTPAWRWWDGAQWSTVTSPPSVAAGPPPPSVPVHPVPLHEADRLVGRSREFARWARAAAWVWAGGAGLLSVLGLAYATSTYRELRFLGQVFDDARNGVTAPPAPTDPKALVSLRALAFLILLGAVVVLAMWQFRAAQASRALGLPGRLSPGIGVAGWFIPVVSYWFPYLAIRDCFPPGHRGRPMVLRMWLAYLATGVLTSATFLVAPFSTPAGVGLTVGTVVAALLFAVAGQSVVSEVTAQQRQLVPISPW